MKIDWYMDFIKRTMYDSVKNICNVKDVTVAGIISDGRLEVVLERKPDEN